MKTKLIALMAIGLVSLTSTGMAQKKKVVILATGGTIAGAAASATQAGYTSGQASIASMIASVPGLTNLADISGEQVANVGSQDMSFEIMLKLRERIHDLFNTGHADGVVVTHGTDTMEETSYFLTLTVNSDKPVVLVGSMRPSTALSADGPLNLFNAVAVAADENAKGRGVLVVMNDRIHEARALTKANTTSVETFLSPLRGHIGSVKYGQAKYFRAPYRKHTTQSAFARMTINKLPRVDIHYACADMPADLIAASVKNGAKGMVVAGVGNGNVNAAALRQMKKAAGDGILVVRSSRVPTGAIGRNVEINDDENNTVASDELNPAKARILLMLALLSKVTVEDVQQLFYEY